MSDRKESYKKAKASFYKHLNRNSPEAISIKKSVDLYQKYGISEPNTLMKKLKELDEKDIDTIELVKHVGSLVNGLNEVVKYLPDYVEKPTSDILDRIKGFFSYLMLINEADSINAVIQTVNSIENIKISARFIAALRQESNHSFERRSNDYMPILLDGFENWHKRLLTEVLKLLKAKRVNMKIPNTYGAIINMCNSMNEFPYLISDDFRIFRNSIAHGNTIVNVDNETIIFVNQKNSGDMEKSKILSLSELCNEMEYLLFECRYLTLMFKKCRRIMNKYKDDKQCIEYLKDVLIVFDQKEIYEQLENST